MRAQVNPEADNQDDDIPLEENYFLDSPEAIVQAVREGELGTDKQTMGILTARKSKRSVMEEDVLIVGAGISGMQAALDLADKGYKVVLIDKTSTIGGAMVKLDKTFPTNDCSICTAAPKMVEVSRHPNITLLTYSELVKLDGEIGNFTAHVWRKSKFVDPDLCTGCGDCAPVCPVIVPNPFDDNLSTRKGVYIEFPQAVPIVYTIDMDKCVGCGMCDRACQPGAISFLEKAEDMEIKIGSVIVATGFEVFEPTTMRREYGYGKYDNVITAMQYERTLSSFGPTSGKVKRPSDHKVPDSVAWIQCVGSRSIQNGWPYCSRVCCMYATKEASITKEANPDMELLIFYMDIRAYGKDFQEYYDKAKKTGVKYIRGRPSSVRENPDKSITIVYKNTLTGKVEEKVVDLLVLSTAIIPNKENIRLADILGIEVDDNGFFKQDDLASDPIASSKAGIYLAGCIQGPKDIPDSVAMASGAAAKAVKPIKDRERHVMKVMGPEKDVSQEEPRIGVFVCHCGKNISNYLDVKKVKEYAKGLDGVVYASDDLFVCSQDVGKKIKDIIKEHDLNRVIVAACSPRTHGGLFMDTIREAGLNRYLFEFANIRNQCSWVHSHDWEGATAKAKDLVRMSVAKARLLEPLYEEELPVTERTLIIGGGVAGMRASLALAGMGIETVLVEREKELGGRLRDLHTVFPSDKKASDIIKLMMAQIEAEKAITVMTETELEDVQGFNGNFTAILNTMGERKEVKFGTAIIATGFKEIDLSGQYGYGKFDGVITQTELEKRFKDGTLGKPRNVVMINCAGALCKERPYCCRVGCGVSLKNAKLVKEMVPSANLFILYRDMRVFGKEEEEYYSDVLTNSKVVTFRYPGEKRPQVIEEEGTLKVRFYDDINNDDYEIEADLVVLTAQTEGDSSVESLKNLFKVPTGVGDFFIEAHAKIRPLDFATDGVFVAGSAHFPKNLTDAIAQAEGAASRAAIPILRGRVSSEGIVSVVDENACSGCGVCISVCPYGAPSFVEGKNIVRINSTLCKGCGSCAAACPSKAVAQSNYKDNQVYSMMLAFLSNGGV